MPRNRLRRPKSRSIALRARSATRFSGPGLRRFDVGGVTNERPAEFGSQGAQLVALVSAVGEQLRLTRSGAEPLQQPASPGRIAPVARRQGQDQRQTVFQDERVQLGRQASARATDRLAPLLVGAPVPS